VNRSALPIDEVLPQLVAALRASASAVLRAPTGAGKTTRVPPAVLEAGLAGNKQIVMLEPRRLAARAAARRISFERGTELGGEIGYHVRFDRKSSRATRILVVTEGVLVRKLQDDPYLEDTGCVIFDEFHERSLDTDLSLAMVRKLQREARGDLKVVAMSATITPDALARFLGDAPVITSEGRLFPVEISYVPSDERTPLHAIVAAGVARALDATAGDVLAFLPGVGEIKRARGELESLARRRDIELFELFGDMSPEQQDAALTRRPRRKIVLATNVAQTSVTIDGITAVVDSGLARTLRFDPGVGLDRLELERISRASADQRAGRAGRTAPGICLRLWSAPEQRSLAEDDEPEIRRVDLAGAALQLSAWGERDLATFGWFEAPAPATLERALELLRKLGALDERGVTALGRRMASMPAHPRIARLLIEGEALGDPGRAALAAALLSERDPFFRPRERRKASHSSESDVLDRVLALEAFERDGRASSHVGELNVSAAQFALRARDQFERMLDGARGVRDEHALTRAVLAAFPDRVAKRREPQSRRGVLANGRGVTLADESAVLEPELFVCVELDAGRRGERAEAFVRIASGVERAWLPRERLRDVVEVAFDDAKERVTASRRTLLDDLVLDEAQTALPDDGTAARALAEAAAKQLERVLPKDDPAFDAFLLRARCLAEWMPELDLPRVDDELRASVPDLCEGRRSFDELRRAPWIDFLRARFTHKQLQALDREAPERLTVPSGSHIAVRYELGKSPVLAVRIQELFGLADTPRIAAGRVNVVMHLLAPNHRPQQITEDLRSFWNNTYPAVSKELKRRYPRHAWPDDPWNAPPERRPKRKPRS